MSETLRNSLVAAIAAAMVALAADFLFWGAEPGLSVALFAAILAAAIAGVRKVGGGELAPVWPVFVLLAGAAGAAAIDFGFANFCVLAVLFLVLAGETFYGDRPRLWARALSQAAASLRFPLALPQLGGRIVGAGLASPWGTAVRLARFAAVVIPALAIGLLFALLLGAGNAVFGSWFGELGKAVWHGLGALSFGRLCFALFTASVALTLIAPARVGPRWWGWTVAREGETPAPPAYLFWQAVAALGTANALFLAANGSDLAYLWARRAIPAGVNAAAYVHEGTGALIAAVLVAGAVLAFFFRRRGGLLPQRAPRLLAHAWIGQCLFLLASVALRLRLYVQDFGLTKTRVELACFLVLVGAGFLLLGTKIARDKSLPWLAAGNALAVFTLFYAVQFWDMGGFVAKWNVDRWEKNPEWKLDIHYLASSELGAGAWKELCRVADTSGRPQAKAEADGFLRKERETPLSSGWRDWQARVAWNRKYLENAGAPPLGDAGWDAASWFIPGTEITVLLERLHHDDTFLAEYRRRLAIRSPDGREMRLDVIDDTGGTVRMNLYRDPQGGYLLRDRMEYHRIDPQAGTIVLLEGNPVHRREGDYLGCFDAGEDHRLVFFPASRRVEAEPPGMMRD